MQTEHFPVSSSFADKSRGRRRRDRTNFSSAAIQLFESVFAAERYPDIYLREQMSQRTGVPEERILASLLLHYLFYYFICLNFIFFISSFNLLDSCGVVLKKEKKYISVHLQVYSICTAHHCNIRSIVHLLRCMQLQIFVREKCVAVNCFMLVKSFLWAKVYVY